MSESLSSTISEDRLFLQYVLTVVSQFIVIFNGKMLLFKFLWLEFRIKSFLVLHVQFNGFMCIRMLKLHAECQISTGAQDWC